VIILQRVGNTLVVNGRRVTVKRILAVTDTHIVVEHLDGRIEAIPLAALGEAKPSPKPLAALV